MEASRAAGVVSRDAPGDLRERRSQLVEPDAGARARRDHGSAGDELLRLDARELERLLLDGIGLRQRDDAVLDPEQPQDREVLVRLRPRALAGVDHEEEEVDAARTRDHRADEALVPGDVDDREARAVRQLERRVAEVDRDPALVLLGQPVGVLAGQRLDERRLAVVDVTRGADRQRHGRSLEQALRAGARDDPARGVQREHRFGMPCAGGSATRKSLPSSCTGIGLPSGSRTATEAAFGSLTCPASTS